ncbi:MAG: nucleotide sugar dehydrogenase [Parcubacteria group bacterium]|jgi:UDP-N-acetyl-D-galactosamine dehydrogenase
MNKIKNTKIAVVGMGYVGLPLAVAFGKKIDTIGFDISVERIEELRAGKDKTKEMSKEKILEAKKLFFTNDILELEKSNFFIVAVPTPVDDFKIPDFNPLIKASASIARVLKKGDVVVYESTVYPGATEEICIPVLEKESGLVYNRDFFAGYSPERISPADKNEVCDIIKVTSGSTIEIGKYIDSVYKEIITAGTFLVDDMKVAEACKVVENTQRDINIAFMNEISIAMNRMGIEAKDVLAAMKTKWNALSFTPGLVGGHCIGVDPYYLIHKAYELGYSMEISRNARIVNDGIPKFIAEKSVLEMSRRKINPGKSKALIMGVSFKENCPDIRNARPFDIAKELKKYGVKVDFFDPIVDEKEVMRVEKVSLIKKPKASYYDVVILAVAHKKFADMGIKKIKALGKKGSGIFFDIKNVFDKKDSDLRL